MYRFAFHIADNLFQNALDGRQPRLHLPAVKGSAVVGQVNADAAHQAGREPGLTTGSPCRQSGQSSGGNASTCRVASAARGTPTWALPPLRSMMEPAASTRIPPRGQYFHHVLGAAAGGNHILHDDRGFAWRQRKPST